jgi:hypothetical protein
MSLDYWHAGDKLQLKIYLNKQKSEGKLTETGA